MTLADVLMQQRDADARYAGLGQLPESRPILPISPPDLSTPATPTSSALGLMSLLGGRMGNVGGGPQGHMGGGSIEQQAHRYFTSQGYSPADWHKVQYIIGHESNWDPHALNEASGAAGIAQKISGFSPDYSRNDPQEQIRWLYNYLGSHNYPGYGTGIDAAYQHKQATGWY